jgi:hypothetical protein
MTEGFQFYEIMWAWSLIGTKFDWPGIAVVPENVVYDHREQQAGIGSDLSTFIFPSSRHIDE